MFPLLSSKIPAEFLSTVLSFYLKTPYLLHVDGTCGKKNFSTLSLYFQFCFGCYSKSCLHIYVNVSDCPNLSEFSDILIFPNTYSVSITMSLLINRCVNAYTILRSLYFFILVRQNSQNKYVWKSWRSRFEIFLSIIIYFNLQDRVICCVRVYWSPSWPFLYSVGESP